MTIDELSEHGVERMDPREIREFLSAKRVGVLGLPTAEIPYMIPLSYGFDNDENLYFSYVVGDTSQKGLVSEETSVARFLVFEAPSGTQWTSVSLEGTLGRIPDHELNDILDPEWRPEALAAAAESERTRMYRFWIQNETGIRHSAVPPGMSPE